jgi:hypothetical protein
MENIMNHMMKFDNIEHMLKWIVENEFYSQLPVSLTVELGE